MRNSISILLVALFAGAGYAGPADRCDPGMRTTKGDSCHHVPARHKPCDRVQVTGCMDFACEPELSSFVAPIGAGTEVSGREFSYVLLPDRIPPCLRSAEDPAIADHVAIRHIFGELFLRNRVLRI